MTVSEYRPLAALPACVVQSVHMQYVPHPLGAVGCNDFVMKLLCILYVHSYAMTCDVITLQIVCAYDSNSSIIGE